MIARVVENWLTRATERQYQFPFCQLLVSKGFRVLHLSSHGPQEQGKDIVAIDPENQPIAFQLKTGDIDLAHFRRIYPEIRELIEVPVQYPGIPADGRHRCVLVTNGTIGDTVRRQIEDLNRKWAVRGDPVLEVIVKGDLLRDFLDLHGPFLPVQLADVNQLLELYLYDGTARLPHSQFTDFLIRNVPIGELPDPREKIPGQRKRRIPKPKFEDVARHLASASILVSYALRSFADKRNFWAIFEAWIMVGAHILAVVERLHLPEQWWRGTFDLTFLAARSALESLVEESCRGGDLLEGDVLVESAVYRARVTILAGLMAAYHLICRVEQVENPYADTINGFIEKHKRELHLWGESAVPYLLILGWYLETTRTAGEAEGLWASVVKALVSKNKRELDRTPSRAAVADPYLECEDALARAMGIKQEDATERIEYDGQAYTLRSIVLLLARRWRRRLISSLWNDIADVNFVEMYPAPSWGFLLWRFPKGDLRITPPKRPQSWAALVQEAAGLEFGALPQRLVARPNFLIAFLCVYPHRLRADSVKVVDDSI